MSARQRVSRRDANIKREELGTSAKDEDMEQAQDDELEQAEARMKMNKGKKNSPSKVSNQTPVNGSHIDHYRSDLKRQSVRAASKTKKTQKTNPMTSMTRR